MKLKTHESFQEKPTLQTDKKCTEERKRHQELMTVLGVFFVKPDK